MSSVWALRTPAQNITAARTAVAIRNVIYDAEGAVEGQLIVKFRPSAADSLAAALASASATRAGFATADELLAAVGVDGIRPLFGSDPRFEERHRAFGLHQWYVVTFDESLPLREMVGELSHDGRIEVLEYARCPRLKNRFPARPLRSARRLRPVRRCR